MFEWPSVHSFIGLKRVHLTFVDSHELDGNKFKPLSIQEVAAGIFRAGPMFLPEERLQGKLGNGVNGHKAGQQTYGQLFSTSPDKPQHTLLEPLNLVTSLPAYCLLFPDCHV